MTNEEVCKEFESTVYSYAKRLSNKFEELPYDDILQDCFIGLIRANKNSNEDILKNSKNRKQKFRNYSKFYMYDEVYNDYLRTKNLVSYPSHIQRYINTYKKGTLNKIPDYRLNESLYLMYKFDDMLLYEDENGPINIPLLISDVKYEGEYTEDLAIRKVFSNEIRNIIFEKAKLTDREKRILIHRYFMKDYVVNLGDVAKIFNVTRERIRQIEAKAFRKIIKVIRYRDLL